MRRPFLSALSVLAATALPAVAAHAEQVYKWVDNTGRVYYGSKPPEGIKAGQVQKVDPRISIVPFVKPDPAELLALERREARYREELEREADRRAASVSRSTAEETMRYWREQCRAQRRVDCEGPNPGFLYDPTFASWPWYGGFYPRVVRARPWPPLAYVPNTAPPGFRIGPGPAGIGAGYVPLPPPQRPMREPARRHR